MRLTLYMLTLLLPALLGGCTSYLPASRVPLPEMGEEVKVVTVPLPVIAFTPNEGATYGALTAFLLHNRKDEVSALIAPQLNENENFGTTGALYGVFYPTPQRNFELNISKSTEVNEAFELRVRDQTLIDQRLEINAYLYKFTDGSARFYGFHSTSSEHDESNFGDKEMGVTFSMGYPISQNTQVVVGERFRRVKVVEGAVRRLPFIRDQFDPDQVSGSQRFRTHAQMISLVYSTLDSPGLPVSGVRARLTAEGSLRRLGSTATYHRYEAEVKGFYPVQDARYISVGRLAVSQARGERVPFLERSILGGETTLRGYGRNRFIDGSYVLLNLEERIRLFRWEVFGVRADWELAPFIDVGGVMRSLEDFSLSDLEFNPGVGFRAVVRPNIVGRIDVGVSNQGPAVFVGLGYPF